jgi:hypothetical protein
MRSGQLDDKPLWLVAIIMFVVGCLIWTLVAYVTAWAIPPHHPAPDSVGFADGHLSAPRILLMAAGWTAAFTLGELWRRRRRARPTARWGR